MANKIHTIPFTCDRCGKVHEIAFMYVSKEAAAPKEKPAAAPEVDPKIAGVVNYLNLVAGTTFNPATKNTVKLVGARIKAGSRFADFRAVIDLKWREWKDDDRMRQYVCPDTLFCEKNFEKYLQAARACGAWHEEEEGDML
jgi:uncharacterized phage protein (TIGR02220 family)